LPEAVNPKTVPKNAIASGSLPYYGWTMTRTARALLKTETLVEEERADIDFRSRHFSSAPEGRTDLPIKQGHFRGADIGRVADVIATRGKSGRRAGIVGMSHAGLRATYPERDDISTISAMI
jgi:hypothetical protein